MLVLIRIIEELCFQYSVLNLLLHKVSIFECSGNKNTQRKIVHLA